MAAKFTGTTVLASPEGGVPLVFFEGDDVPEWASDQVGDHLVEKSAPRKSAAKSES